MDPIIVTGLYIFWMTSWRGYFQGITLKVIIWKQHSFYKQIITKHCCFLLLYYWLLQPRSFYSVNSGGLVRISTTWPIKMCPCVLLLLWIFFYSLNGIKEQKNTLSQSSCVHSIKSLDPLHLKFNGKQKVGLPISVTLHFSPSYWI